MIIVSSEFSILGVTLPNGALSPEMAECGRKAIYNVLVEGIAKNWVMAISNATCESSMDHRAKSSPAPPRWWNCNLHRPKSLRGTKLYSLATMDGWALRPGIGMGNVQMHFALTDVWSVAACGGGGLFSNILRSEREFRSLTLTANMVSQMKYRCRFNPIYVPREAQRLTHKRHGKRPNSNASP